MALSEIQKRFCEIYVKTGNATQSYIDAGYKAKPNAARRNASRLLSNADVKAYISELSEQMKQASIVDAVEAMQILATIARGDREEEVLSMNPLTGKMEKYMKKPDNGAVTRAVGEIMKRYPLPVEVNLNAPTAININFDFAGEDMPEPEDD